MKRTLTVMTVMLSFGVAMVAPIAVQAGSTGRRNTAIAGTATAAYLLIKGKTVPGLAVGAASAYAWKRYGDSRKHETRTRAYRAGYASGYQHGKHKVHKHKACKHYRSR